MLDPELTVSQVLAAYPQAWRAFLALKTDCVGCYLMSFCTLREVADQYHLSLEKILAEISGTIQVEIDSGGGTHET